MTKGDYCPLQKYIGKTTKNQKSEKKWKIKLKIKQTHQN